MSLICRRAGARAGDGGAATVELVLVAIPILLLTLLAVGAIGRLVTTQLALGGITRDAARTAVTASSAGHAQQLARQHAQQAAVGYGLDPDRLTLQLDPGTFARGGALTVTATYQLTLGPTLTATLTDTHAEIIDPHQSR